VRVNQVVKISQLSGLCQHWSISESYSENMSIEKCDRTRENIR